MGPDHPDSTVDWEALATSSGTIVILMGVAHLREICTGLTTRGLHPGTPAAVVAKAATPGQHVIRGTLASLADVAAAANVETPAIIVIGAVVALDLQRQSRVSMPAAQPEV